MESTAYDTELSPVQKQTKNNPHQKQKQQQKQAPKQKNKQKTHIKYVEWFC